MALTVLLGGARSGKSALAVRLARKHDGPVTYVATCPRIEGDDDLADRIARHRAERPVTWETIEEQHDLAGALADAGEAFAIVDCLTTWVGNLMFRGDDPAAIESASERAIDATSSRSTPTVVISNEVGLGIVPESPLGREYRDVLGRVNQQWAAAADRALFLVAGKALRLEDP